MECEATKERLTQCDMTDVEVTLGALDLACKVTRAEFELLIADILATVPSVTRAGNSRHHIDSDDVGQSIENGQSACAQNPQRVASGGHRCSA